VTSMYQLYFLFDFNEKISLSISWMAYSHFVSLLAGIVLKGLIFLSIVERAVHCLLAFPWLCPSRTRFYSCCYSVSWFELPDFLP
jgi:hypothetical protein